jgi:hypothetical protein
MKPSSPRALKAHVALRVEAERLIAAYVAPESDRPTIVNNLITLFDGPQQRERRGLRQRRLATWAITARAEVGGSA